MFTSQNGYSLSDIAAVTNANGRNGSGDGFFGGDNGWWIILLFLLGLGGGWGNGGFGGNGYGGTTVREEVAYGFDMNGLENSVRGVQQGLCDGFYAINSGLLTGFNGVQSTLCQGFAGVNAGAAEHATDIISAINADTIANMQNTTALTAQMTSLATGLAGANADIQRALERGFSETNYNLATQTCQIGRSIADATRDIIDSNNAGVRSILDFLTQDKISTLTAENQSLKFAASQSAQNAYLVNALREPCPVPAYIVPNPNCCTTPVVAYSGCQTPCFA